MSAVTLHEGAKGFDCDTPLRASTAVRFLEHGYAFTLRYVPRIAWKPTDINPDEVGVLRAAGLGLMIVQHVESDESWDPSIKKGAMYGETAAKWCVALGIAPGTNVWLDLEGVAPHTPHETTIAYCNTWYDAVRAQGFSPGLYVGWHCGLTPNELYRRLKFRHYWAAYNLNADEYPSVRGVQLRQREVRAGDVPVGIGTVIDVNIVTGDALGGFPVMDR